MCIYQLFYRFWIWQDLESELEWSFRNLKFQFTNSVLPLKEKNYVLKYIKIVNILNCNNMSRSLSIYHRLLNGSVKSFLFSFYYADNIICKRTFLLNWEKMQHQSIFWCKHFCNCFSPFSQSVPKPIALEPCFGNKAAVLSIFVRLPRSPGGIPPPGQSGGLASQCNLPPHRVLNIFTLSAAEAIIMTVRNTSLSSLFSGLAVGSALVDVSQQMCLGYKEKSGGLRSRKQQPLAQPATCIWHLPIVLWPRSHRSALMAGSHS